MSPMVQVGVDALPAGGDRQRDVRSLFRLVEREPVQLIQWPGRIRGRLSMTASVPSIPGPAKPPAAK